MKRSFFRQPSLLSVLTTAFIVLGVLISASIITLLYNNFKVSLREELKNRLASIATIAGLQQDGDTLLKVSARDDEFYKKINENNLKIKLSDPDLIYVYTMRRNEEGIYFIVDANQPGDEGIADFGQIYDEPGPTLVENFDTITETIVEPEVYTDEFGSFLSAYTPIYSSDGEKVAVLGVDIDANNIVSKERQFLFRSLLVFLASLPIIALLGYLLGRQLTAPLTELTNTVLKIAEGNLDEQASEPTSSKEAALLAVSFKKRTRKLKELVDNLEVQVAERTSRLENRASQLEIIANVARSTASLQDIEELLPSITELVSQRFGFYHTGIFLLDETQEYAHLRAANSEGGKRMLERQHKLKLDRNSIVGYVTSQDEPRIALDVGTDAVFFNNPDLPDTRSEMALPLRVGGNVIGALDVQSTESNAFTEEDISILSTLADQVAIAIENARLFSESREALRQSEETFTQYAKQEWSSYAKHKRTMGYKFDGTRTTPLNATKTGRKRKDIPKTGTIALKKETNELSIPIRFRGQVIGTFDVKSKSGKRQWTPNDITLLEAAAERTALALENARLVESSQMRASRERTIGEISAKIGAVSDIETIMQIAVEELGRKIAGAAEVSIEIDS